MLGLEFVHMGMNNDSAEEAVKGAKLFEKLFGLTVKDGNKSLFAGDAFEFMKSKGPGKYGHIAIRTNFQAPLTKESYLALLEDLKK